MSRLLLLCVALASCAAHRVQVTELASAPARAGSIARVAVLPLMGAPLVDVDNYELCRSISSSLRDSQPELDVLEASHSIALMKEHRISGAMLDVVEQHYGGPAVAGESLPTIGRRLQVDAVLFGRVVVGGERVGGGAGRGEAHDDETEVAVELTVLDVRNGQVVWEARCDAAGDGPRGRDVERLVTDAPDAGLRRLPPL